MKPDGRQRETAVRFFSIEQTPQPAIAQYRFYKYIINSSKKSRKRKSKTKFAT